MTFTVAASGDGPLTYQWRRNGTAIAGATGSSFTLAAVTADDVGALFTVVVTNTAGSVTSAAASIDLTRSGADANWLWGQAGRADVDPDSASTLGHGVRFNLVAVDPLVPTRPLTLEAKGLWGPVTSFHDGAWNGSEFKPGPASSERVLVYAKSRRLWRLDLRAGTTGPVPTLLSNAGIEQICGVLRTFPDGKDALRSVLLYGARDTAGNCSTTDFLAFRPAMAATDAPIATPDVLFALRNSDGAITGFVARRNNRILKLDANLANAVDLFGVGASSVATWATPTPTQPRWVFRDGDDIRSADLTAPSTPVTLYSVAGASAAQALGVHTGTVPTLVALQDQVVRACALTGCGGAPATLLTLDVPLATSAIRIGDDNAAELWAAIRGFRHSRVLHVGSTLVASLKVDQATSLGVDPNMTSWVLTPAYLASHSVSTQSMSSVPRNGGTETVFAPTAGVAGVLPLFPAAALAADRAWAVDLPNSALRLFALPGTALLRLDDAHPLYGNDGLDNALNSELLYVQGYAVTSATPFLNTTLKGVDAASGQATASYGSLAASVSRLTTLGAPGGGRPRLLQAEGLPLNAENAKDLFFLRGGQAGLVRCTSFIQ